MDKILPFDYLKGEAFTEKLKDVTGCKTLLEMSERFDVPKATFSAWNTHERTSHELMVRLHLALGVPIEELALKPEDQRNVKSSLNEMKQRYEVASVSLPFSPQHATTILKSFCLANGQLIETGEIPYPVRRMNSFNLDAEKVIEVETNEAIYLLDKSTTDAVAGNYLIDVDGRLSINQIQRLPGRKLAIAFGDSTIEASENDIKVLGRVAVTMKKD
ncbi:chromosome partitioning protein ParA [Vibrio anguillarum]|uniref:phage repressor protein CI n=5 Tax=Vibrio anguillarum TaxID=55601 RepID=UPI00188C7F31|nr:phage repressor protein CI [Vibrio anguillarum]MBF4257558.1 chromosome partitioning protein ParA [Vibrio anguillarum]MBF4278093.1 chromosome partitioning protein ParA [Vibrio anguillarum]MBF4300573.1 chromosome partitioning protein ParA [Vibrio anguillarum]MBF4397995.1 chromosome partitioning protein ParA [Vibrio anguillarum]MBF4440122.1 chromosome partitioning protein ParA [Vibrio anguillarum]